MTDAQARCLGDASCAPLAARVAELRRKEDTGWQRNRDCAFSLPSLLCQAALLLTIRQSAYNQTTTYASAADQRLIR